MHRGPPREGTGRPLDEGQAARPIAPFHLPEDPLAGSIQAKANVVCAGLDQPPHLVQVVRQNGHIERQTGSSMHGMEDRHRLLERILRHGHL